MCLLFGVRSWARSVRSSSFQISWGQGGPPKNGSGGSGLGGGETDWLPPLLGRYSPGNDYSGRGKVSYLQSPDLRREDAKLIYWGRLWARKGCPMNMEGRSAYLKGSEAGTQKPKSVLFRTCWWKKGSGPEPRKKQFHPIDFERPRG